MYRISRSSVYARRRGAATAEPSAKRGPKTRWSDDEVVSAIQEVLRESPAAVIVIGTSPAASKSPMSKVSVGVSRSPTALIACQAARRTPPSTRPVATPRRIRRVHFCHLCSVGILGTKNRSTVPARVSEMAMPSSNG